MAEEISEEKGVEIIKGMVREEAKRLYDEMKASERALDKSPEDQIREVLNPYIEPVVRRAQLDAADAKDEASFYRKNPEAIRRESEIEELVKESAKRGQQFTRDTIYAHLVGRDYLKDRDKWTDERIKERDEALKRAQYAEDFSAGGYGRLKPEHIDLAEKFRPENFRKLPKEEKAKLLEGLAL